ncbi:hypothetical protein GCM10027594_14320 [Hymenobacter agri]
MKTPAAHLQLVFLASTVGPAWGVGWAFTNTTVRRPQAGAPPVPATRFRLALQVS